MPNEPPTFGPQSIRTFAKPERSATPLQDVNRCSVRPADLIAHRGYTVLVTDRGGRIGNGLEGFYLHRTRFLSRLGIRVDEAEPLFVSANVVDHHFITSYHLAPSPAGRAAGATPDDESSARGEIVQKGIEVQVNAFCGGGLRLDIIVTNHAMAETEVTLSLDLAADFADLTEAQSGKREQQALVARRWTDDETGDAGEIALRYQHPDLDLATRIRISGADRLTNLGRAVACQLHLSPHDPRLISVAVIPVFQGEPFEPFFGHDGSFPADASSSISRRQWVEGCAHLAAANEAVQAAWERAVSDLASLQLLDGTGAEPFMIAAGMPNYTGLFGRDAYITGLQTAALNPATLRGALQVISRWNADTTDDLHDAEPGKVLHQRERGPLAQLGKTPYLHYYGDYSTPGLFLLAAAADLAHTADFAYFRSLRDKLLLTLEWMERSVDSEGFYPYRTRSPQGIKNQSWKDSGEAVLYPDGRMVQNPIAISDVQGLYYAGKQAIALAFAAAGEQDRAERLLAEAATLKRRFNERFWMPEERYFAMALDPDHQQVRTIASDPSACLAYGIVDDDKAGAVAERLLADDMFSGWGIRTLSSRHPAFNPFAYHLGSVWPSPNSIAAYGLKRYGFDAAMQRVAEGLFAASQIFDLDRLPEVFGGHTRDARHPHPGLYPGACSPQAWSAGAVILLVTTMLGLLPLAPQRVLIVDPALPEWLPEMTLRNIQVGPSRARLRFRRDASGHTEVEVFEDGGLAIRRLPPAEGPLSQGKDRVAAAIRSALAA
ncbi:MAG: amylo-alpha-1,6-glucosidase [Acetobacteraceae bacterium]